MLNIALDTIMIQIYDFSEKFDAILLKCFG